MPIKTKCQCGHEFNARESLAGRRVKCPQCSGAVKIPGKGGGSRSTAKRAATKPAGGTAAAADTASKWNATLLGLLDEEGVQAAPTGAVCPSCGSDMAASAVLCIQCGFNVATGEHLETVVDNVDEGPKAHAHLDKTDADKLMAKAEKDIAEVPVSGVGADFGEGADSFLIALGAIVVLLVMVATGVGTVLLMDRLTEAVSPAFVSFVASIGVAALCALWIGLSAFKSSPAQGLLCLATLGVYGVFFGIKAGRSLMILAIIYASSVFIGLASGYYVFYVLPRQSDFY